MKVEPREREASDERRCPICHGSMLPSEPLWECPECAAVHHGACARQHGRCAALGCRGAPRREGLAPRDPVADRRAWRLHLVHEGIFWSLLVGSGAFSIVGIADGMRRMKSEDLMTTGSPAVYAPLAFFAFFGLCLFRFRHSLR